MTWRVGHLGLLLILTLVPASGLAASLLEAESRIEAVTVFPDRAEVTRALELSLPAGEAHVFLCDAEFAVDRE